MAGLYDSVVGRLVSWRWKTCIMALEDLHHGVGRLVSWRWKTCIMALLEDLYNGVVGRLVLGRCWQTCIRASCLSGRLNCVMAV